MLRRAALIMATLAIACAPARPLVEGRVLDDVAHRYHQFYPTAGDPDPTRDAGLLKPRFGLPALARAGTSFEVELLERGAAPTTRAALIAHDLSDRDADACLDGAAIDGCHRVTLTAALREPLDGGAAIQHVVATSDAPPGGWDLYLRSSVDGPTRAPRSVWLYADDPTTPRPLRVAQLSDLHIGKGRVDGAARIEAHLRQVIAEVNALAPDLVVVTGDLVNLGQDPSLAPRARQLLLGLAAPVLVVVGNHDLGFGVAPNLTARYGPGWSNFARSFHASLYYTEHLGGWDFVGFDSGPSSLSPRVLVRGVAPETLSRLSGELASSRAAGDRGVVLFSHAPSRALLSDDGDRTAIGYFGRMRDGHAAFESLLLDAAARGQRVIHLAGHTHWSDVFEARPAPGGKHLRFERWPVAQLSPCATRIDGRAALVTTQAATHSGLPLRATAQGYGFALLTLGDEVDVAFHGHDARGLAIACVDDRALARH